MRGHKWGGVLLVTALLVAVASPAQALLKVKLGGCPSGIRTSDPIKFYNEPEGQGHPHQFFGNQAPVTLGNATTDADLLASPVPCQTVGDTAGYWSPPVYSRDPVTAELVLVTVQQFTAYYRAANGSAQGAAQPIPAGAHLIADVHTWSCGQFGGVSPSQTFTDCRGLSGKPGRTLTGKVTFPSCWDGALNDHTVPGNTSDNSHFAYRVGKVCPAGFPIGVTELRETVQYQYTGDPAALVLASDEMNGVTGGLSYHADVMEDWQPGAQEVALTRCVTPSKQASNCG